MSVLQSKDNMAQQVIEYYDKLLWAIVNKCREISLDDSVMPEWRNKLLLVYHDTITNIEIEHGMLSFQNVIGRTFVGLEKDFITIEADFLEKL